MSTRHHHTPIRTSAVATIVAVVLLATVAACGNGGDAKSADTTATPSSQVVASTTDGSSKGSGSGTTGKIQEDPDHQVVVVNLTRDGSNPGPAFDVFQVPQEAEGLTAKETGLAFGQATPWIHPGRKASSFDTGDYGLTLVPTGSTDRTTDQVVMQTPTSDWKKSVQVATGESKSAGFFPFYVDPPGNSGNSVPASESGKVVLVASKAFVGQPNDPSSGITDSVLFGPPGACLPSTDPTLSSDPAAEVTQVSRFVVPAGTATVGFWTSTKNQWTPADCAGQPIATADISSLKAGDRALVLLNGPSPTQVSATVVRIPD